MDDSVIVLRGQLGERPISFELGPGQHVLGRGHDCQVILEEPSVSRRHARVHIDGGVIILEDLKSSNGTRVDDVPIDGPVRLHPRARLQLGNLLLMAEPASGTQDVYLDQSLVREHLAVSLDEARRDEGSTDLGGKKAHLFRILAEASELLTGSHGPEQIFDPLLALVERALQPERVVLLLSDEDHPEPRPVASRVSHDAPGALIISRTLMSRVLSDRQAFLTRDASQDERLLGGESLVNTRVRSAMAAPLLDGDEVIGILYADTIDPGVQYDRDELTAFVLMANVVSTAITHARHHAVAEERQRLATELDAARLIMSRLLPRELPRLDGVQLAASLEPCDEVAGDLYDARRLPDGRLLIVLGDVSGHGLPAALLVAALLPAIRLAADGCGDLGQMAARINDQLFEATDAVRFATLFLGRLDPATGQLEYVNAGHNPPLLLAGDTVELLPSSGPPVGMLPEMAYGERQATLPDGAQLLLFTDGVTEAQRDDEQMYGDERLVDLVRGCSGDAAQQLQCRILDDVAAFTAGARQTDDVTVMVVKREQANP